jgi:6-phosphogluconolactonase
MICMPGIIPASIIITDAYCCRGRPPLTKPIVTILSDTDAQAAAAAGRLTSVLRESCALRGSATICFTGGRTAQRVYEQLADARLTWRGQIAWATVHAFWGDERQVPSQHVDSNAGMTHRSLFAHVPVPSDQIHPVRADLPDAAAAAIEYEGVLPATFDVMLLGLGADAHIASIFTGSPLLDCERDVSGLEGSRVRAVWVDHLKAWRITLTPTEVLNARAILVLASGADKATAVHAALDAPTDVTRWPAQLLRAAGDRVEWIIDAAAARLLAAPLA